MLYLDTNLRRFYKVPASNADNVQKPADGAGFDAGDQPQPRWNVHISPTIMQTLHANLYLTL
jgi:hypothetical protein